MENSIKVATNRLYPNRFLKTHKPLFLAGRTLKNKNSFFTLEEKSVVGIAVVPLLQPEKRVTIIIIARMVKEVVESTNILCVVKSWMASWRPFSKIYNLDPK